MHHSGWPCRQSWRRVPLRGRQRRVPRWPGFFAAWTGPNDGAVKVANTNGWVTISAGTSFMPPAAPAMIRWNTSPWYSCEHD